MAFDVLSSEALARLTEQQSQQRLPHSLQAESGYERYGERLGFLLATLKLGEQSSRSLRDDWDESYWDYWSGVRSVVLGGGLVEQSDARGMVDAARRLLDQAVGPGECDVRVHPHPSAMPLLGCARIVPERTSSAIVADFGQTSIKLAHCEFDSAGPLRRITLANVIPAASVGIPSHGPTGDLDGFEVVGQTISRVLAKYWLSLAGDNIEVAPVFVVSLATYLDGMGPENYWRGPYAQLNVLGKELGPFIAEQVGRQIGRDASVEMVHDGTAAALAVAPAAKTAVITLGTAIGWGIPVTSRKLRPVIDAAVRTRE